VETIQTDVEGWSHKQVSSLYPSMLVYLPRQLLLGPLVLLQLCLGEKKGIAFSFQSLMYEIFTIFSLNIPWVCDRL